MASSEITDDIPPEFAQRVTGATLKDGRAVLVLDASGLDEAERSAIERDLAERLTARADVDEVRVVMTAERRPAKLIAIGSGKGGVGKSTLTANLAIALARRGLKVGLVDADIYGPSQPMLFDTGEARPEARDDKLVPVSTRFGVSLLSMGQLIGPGRAIAWRGPMVGKALAQMIDAQWGDADVILIDLPPGTGDVQLTMVQKYRPAGALLVSTPQDLALIDAARAGQFFEAAGVPVIGLVENMAGYACPHCGEVSDPFGSGGVEAAAARLDLPFLGRIPLELAIRQGSDAGDPPAARDTAQAEHFHAIAGKLAEWLGATG